MNQLVLTSEESNRFQELEIILAKGLLTFVDVGNALLEIRDSRLYREKFDTFEDYCRQRWRMTKSRANQLVAAVEVAGNLTTTVAIAPTSERQIRPLAKLEPGQQRDAWTIATELNSNPTAAQVQEAVIKTQKKFARPITEEEKRLAEIKALEQERRLGAQNLYAILGTLTMDEPVKILDYDREYFAGYHFELTKEVWKRAITTLQECAKQWKG